MNLFKKKNEAKAEAQTGETSTDKVEVAVENKEESAAEETPSSENPAVPAAESVPAEAAATQSNVSAEIAEYASSMGMANMAGEMIRTCTTLEAAKAFINNARATKIVNLCKLAGKEDQAQAFISSDKSFEAVQNELIGMMADESKKTDVSATQSPNKVAEDFLAADSIVVKDAERRATESKTKK